MEGESMPVGFLDSFREQVTFDAVHDYWTNASVKSWAWKTNPVDRMTGVNSRT